MSHHEDNPWAKEAEENQSKQRQSNIDQMKWKPGEHTIRIMPARVKGALPFVKYIVHWIPIRTAKNDRPIIHAVGYRCPVCEFVGQLWGEIYRLKEEEEMTDKDPAVQKLLKQASKLRGKKTYDMNIIHRNDYKKEDGEIKIKRLVAGPTIWKSIIELGNSDKWGNPSAPGERGYDLTVTVDGEGLKREYTILPDPERRPLTDEEEETLKKSGYDLEKLRKFSTAAEILEVLTIAKAPLDGLNMKNVKKSLAEDLGGANVGNDDDDEKPKTNTTTSDDDDDDKDVTPPDDDDSDSSSNDSSDENEDEEENEKNTKAEKKESEKEEKAFDEDADKDEDSDSEGDDGLQSLDCRGTYDDEDVGCEDCDHTDDCKKLQKEFKAKAKELDIDISEMSGVEIEKEIKKQESEKVDKKESSGKQGKGKQGKSSGKSSSVKRDLPF